MQGKDAAYLYAGRVPHMIGPNTEGKENNDDILSSELFTKHLLGLFEAETVFLEAAEILSQEKVQENVSH